MHVKTRVYPTASQSSRDLEFVCDMNFYPWCAFRRCGGIPSGRPIHRTDVSCPFSRAREKTGESREAQEVRDGCTYAARGRPAPKSLPSKRSRESQLCFVSTMTIPL